MIAIGDGKRKALFIYIVCVFKGCPLFLKRRRGGGGGGTVNRTMCKH